ncbi:hypothetical protein [Halomonas caseinilytica]|uniref:hypothetical protein n=1 Tax=Halomonas caseinilytica TaxID=438744 RepID=UPI0007E546C5|nr:hypothetical protein [Halomonas caseinilytica]SEN67812.1 hypothetical protein SAMN04487952_1248 [Halomonas caseinilytica]
MNHLAATKCNYRSSITDDIDHALRMAEDRAEISGRRYGVFSCGAGKVRVRRVTGRPQSALEIVTPSWSYDAEYRAQRAGEAA